MASGLAPPTNIFVFTKLHKVLEVLEKQCHLAQVACSRLDTPHEGRPGTVVDLYRVAAMLGASPRDCKFRTCEEFARALRAAVREGPSNKDVVVATETLLRDKLPRAITSQPHEVMQALAQIVEQLLADKEFKSSFGSPPTDAIARGYSQAVRHPVGLLPILSRLRRRGGYALASEAALDLRRIGSNCLTFNVHNGIKAAAPAVKELRRLALRYLGVLDAKLAAFVDTKQFALSDSSWVSGKHEGADVTAVRQQLVGALETIVDGDGMTSFVWPLDNTDFFAKYSEHAAAVGVLGRPVALLEAIEDLHCRLLPSRSGAIALILAPFQTGATVWRALGDAGVASSCDAELQRALRILSADLGIPHKRRHTEQVGKSVHLDAVAKANKKAVLAVLKKLEAAKAPVRLGPNAGRLIQPASIFLAPVESTPDFASDYYTKIRKPMDLGTIRCKVVHNEYCLVQDLVADVRLMLANCRTFNKGNEDVLFFADELAKAFENVTKSSKQFQQSGSSFLNPAASNKGTGKPSRFFN
ncbi:hypothetical protein FNF29_01075 [Cafeteria roenbergensis]|uniref:Bromo domain-containing protein n=1 Tax=Cafeteria roenbergensis TaxID=33653 RepID=A0A5A8CT00_CAFRO|nr:hypothetical protein FNF29_01075 [Cafeteria roenbergensis]|eukprot:KAA0156282.1 hypothetical protein FNF29_01075 [Cafeteria roenbergensis]